MGGRLRRSFLNSRRLDYDERVLLEILGIDIVFPFI